MCSNTSTMISTIKEPNIFSGSNNKANNDQEQRGAFKVVELTGMLFPAHAFSLSLLLLFYHCCGLLSALHYLMCSKLLFSPSLEE